MAYWLGNHPGWWDMIYNLRGYFGCHMRWALYRICWALGSLRGLLIKSLHHSICVFNDLGRPHDFL